MRIIFKGKLGLTEMSFSFKEMVCRDNVIRFTSHNLEITAARDSLGWRVTLNKVLFDNVFDGWEVCG